MNLTTEKTDIASSVFWFLVGLYVCAHSYKFGFGAFAEPGPGFIFFLSAVLLCTFSAANAFFALFRILRKQMTPYDEWSNLAWQKNISVFVALLLYLILFEILGFLISTFLLLFFMFKIIEPTRWWIAVALSFVSMASCYMIFIFWLKVPFPTGRIIPF